MPAPRAARPTMPATVPGLRIGLFGGSFDPPHAGHRHASLTALRRLGLDRVWWLVSPGNPLKDTGRLPSIGERMRAAARVAAHPRVVVTDLEARLGTRYTLDLMEALVRLKPDVRFVFLIGADNWATFHRWQDWRRIAATMPIAVVDRPGSTLKALASPAARTFASARVPERDAAGLADRKPPAWVFLTGHRVPISSTVIRLARTRRNAGLPPLVDPS
ncbi:nicotinate-nucleotide adenylyltransferase [Chthonobacter rhizosphaerae]|uniref:nicotinate-nucleotide adenylyltransferase n=1 Tax=Chthonobacter rhizosphaerae TaxID=2735553 RepID=UPI0015EFD766|nr:nicotinate-nucleotide adenylyltransferase [Chthonobacter rhizosphaerae]